MRVRTRCSAVLGARTRGRADVGRRDQERGARLRISLRLLDRDVRRTDSRRNIRRRGRAPSAIRNVDGVGEARTGARDDRRGGILFRACGDDDVGDGTACATLSARLSGARGVPSTSAGQSGDERRRAK